MSDEESCYTYIYKFQNGKLKCFSREHLLSEDKNSINNLIYGLAKHSTNYMFVAGQEGSLVLLL